MAEHTVNQQSLHSHTLIVCLVMIIHQAHSPLPHNAVNEEGFHVAHIITLASLSYANLDHHMMDDLDVVQSKTLMLIY